MGNHDGAAGERQQRFFQRPQGFHVQIVGGLIEQQHVGALLEQLGQVQAVALAPGQVADPLLLVAALEVEAAQVGAAGHLVVADAQNVVAVGHLFPDGLVGVQVLAALVHVGQVHGVAHLDVAGVRRFLTGEHTEQGGLTRAVGADDADNGAARHREAQIFIEQLAVELLGDAVDLEHLLAEALAWRNVQFLGLVALLEVLAGQLLEGAHPGLVLGAAALGVLAHPFQLFLHRLAVGAFLLLFLLQALLLLLQPGGVVALPGNAVAPVQFQDPLAGVVQEVAVVGHRHHGAGELVQEALQPGHGLGVQVVGGLIQQQHVRGAHQQAAQCHPAALTTGQVGYIGVPGRKAQGVGGDIQAALDIVRVGGLDNAFQFRLLLGQLLEIRVFLGVGGVHLFQALLGAADLGEGLLDDLAHVLVRVQLRFLGQVTDVDARLRARLAQVVLVDAGHDAQQGGFTGAVEAQHADLGAREEGQRDVLEDLFLRRDDLAHLIHGENVLGHKKRYA